eukprot:jgi/Astpho2/7038/fgenesh1_pm.00107_%23_26_t
MLQAGSVQLCPACLWQSREATRLQLLLLTVVVMEPQHRPAESVCAKQEGELELPFGEVRGHTREWVAQEPIQREIGRRFRNFLDRFKDDNGDLVYRDRIKDMCIRNEQSLVISFEHFSMAQPEIAMWFVDVPRLVIDVFNRNAKDAVLSIMPSYENVQPDIFVRFEGMPIVDKIRDIRQFHLNRLVRFQGVVTRRTGVFPQLQMVKYDCVKCGYILGPFFQNNEKEVKPGSCPQCQSQGPWNLNVAETVYRNYQKMTVQESPGTVPAGRLPRHKEVILLHDLIDKARPGEEVDVTAIYTNTYDAGLNVRNGFPVFSTSMEAQWVARNEDLYSAFKLTDEDRAEIHQLARDPNIGKRIVKSIAPSIYGHLNIKAGVALAMFGGQAKQPSGKHRLRGDINMLVLGDPGTAKSQFLKYVEKVAQRAVYTTGKGASAVGLTASVQKDPITREWTLEGGALVLADKGVCLIDEFDKMNDQDRVSIHEAMEQQSISISKAGIVTQLQARCSVMAAANPVGGRYDSSRTFAENVELTDPILSRFDILCVVKDIVDPVLDEHLAEFVISSHMHSHPNQAELNNAKGPELEPDMLSQDMLRKYITYAKANCRPKLQNADYEKITQVYADLRRESAISHGMPIAVRHLESIIRMSEAHAAMHLREYVNSDDVDMAIRVMLESFISTQKTSVQKAMTKRFRHYLSHAQDLNDLILHALQGLVREQLRAEQVTGEAGGSQITIPCRALEERVREYDVLDIKQFFASPHFLNAGFDLDQGAAVITRPR